MVAVRSPALTRWRPTHPGLLVLAGLAAVLRLLIDRRNPPGVTQDSLVYLQLAEHAPLAPFSPTRPSGYPLVLRLLDVLPGSHLDVVTAVQHASGVAVGAMVYLLVLRAGASRNSALVAAAIPLVDAYTVAMEQAVLAEAVFTLTVVASAFLVLRGPRPGMWAVAASGVLLGLACTMRTVGLFIVPVWLLWLFLADFGRRALLAGLAAVAVPVLAYCTMHAVQDAGFSLVGADGWYLYAKVAPVADCRRAAVPPAALPLCAGPRDRTFEYYLYDSSSPAYQLVGAGPDADLEEIVTPENNRLLRRFSQAVIGAHPLDFAREVTKEFFRYLGPAEAQNESKLYGTPGSVLALYERWVHLTWVLVAATVCAGVLVIVLGRRAREVALLLGATLALILGAAATSGFNNRYLVPTLPFLAVIAVLAVNEARVRARGRRRAVPA